MVTIIDEIFDRQAVVLIEWGERFPDLMPADRIEVHIFSGADEIRTIVVTDG